MAHEEASKNGQGFAVDAPRTCVTLFGDFRFCAPNGSPVTLANRRARALLAMLCIEPGRPVARETLTRFLWPGRFEAQARASLRQCLLELGKTLEASDCTILSVTRDRIGIVPERVTTDLGALEQALNAGDVGQIGAILHAIGTRPLLDEMHLGDSFTEWLNARRDEIEHRIGAGIAETVARLRRTGNAATAARLHEAWAVRENSLHRPTPAASHDGKARVAVLPFLARGGGEHGDYFGDGIADELISSLGQVPQLLVTGRISSFHFRGSGLALPAIAKTLQVSHVIEGSVQRQGEAVRVHVHLIDGQTGFELWGDRYDGTLDTIFKLQETVAQAVTRALATALALDMPAPLVRDRTDSKAAYDLYLQGRSLCSRVMGDGVLDKGIALLEQALALDPDFAECWVVLAEAHQMVAVYTQCPDRPAAVQRMADCARRAITLSPDLGYPHCLLGVERWTQGDIVGALDLAFKGYRLEPVNPAVTMRLAWMLVYCGRTADAAPFIAAAVDQDPVDGRKYALVWALHMARGDLQAARETGLRMVDLAFPSMYLAFATAALGEHELAVEQYQLTKQLVNTIIMPPVGAGAMTPEAMDAYWLMAAKGVCSGIDADRRAYWQMLEFMYATLPDKGDLAITGPAIFTGNAELAFKTLGEHGSAANMLAFLPLWTQCEPICHIWQHEEFIPFAQRIGMAAAWDKYGWPDLLPPPSNRA